MFTHKSKRQTTLTNLHQLLHNSPFHSFVGMMEDMDEYGVHADAEDIVFDEEELDDSDVEEDHNIEVSEQQPEMQQVISK
jgi:hypothetical protein